MTITFKRLIKNFKIIYYWTNGQYYVASEVKPEDEKNKKLMNQVKKHAVQLIKNRVAYALLHKR
jgi:hypothetical protein